MYNRTNGLGCCDQPRGVGQYDGFYQDQTPTGPPPARGEQWWLMIPEVWSVYEDLTGGDSGSDRCWTGYANRPFSEPCLDTPDYDAVARAVERAPDSDIAKLIGYLLDANSGRGPKSRGALQQPECIPFWVKAILGGKGCVASKYPEAPAWFLAMVRTYGAAGSVDDLYPGSAIKTGLAAGAMLPVVIAGLAFLFIPKLLGKG